MSAKIDGAESNVAEKDVSDSSPITSQHLTSDVSDVVSNIEECAEGNTSDVQDNLKCQDDIKPDDISLLTANRPPSSNISKEEPHSENTEDVNSQETVSVSRSTPEPNVQSVTETERTEGSDDGSDYKDAEVSKEGGHNDSDSESQVGSESSIEGMRTGRRNRRASNEMKDTYSDDESLDKGDSESEPQGARESGDGEEKTKDKVLDRDEDKKDPQYIPKKGVFYEHDDRTSDSGPATTTEDPKEIKKKKFTADKIDRWGHDMYDTSKQTPKSTQDLIDYYGYDIRNEEEPPKAWRSRRYGRGPNKYTRQWQDEAAYRNKRQQPTKPPAPFKNNIEDFPTMEQSKSGYRRNRGRNVNTPDMSTEMRGSLNKSQSSREARQETSRRKTHPDMPSVNPLSNVQTTQMETPIPVKEPKYKETKYKDIQIEKTIFLNKKKPFSTMKTKSEAEAEADIAALSKEFSNAVINIGRDGKILPIGSNSVGGNSNGNNHKAEKVESKEVRVVAEPQPQVQQIPSSGGEVRVKERRDMEQRGVSSKSKRYSTQRQRSLPQSNHMQQQQQPQQPPQQQQQFIHQQQFYPPPPPQPVSAPDTVPDSALFSGFQNNPPPVYTDSMQGVVFLPGYPPTPPTHLLNYCPAPQQYGIPPPPPLGPPPPDMYPAQPPPGITYYSPQSQVQPRPPASRRVKVAIPIVAPPEQQAQSDQTCS